MNKTFLSGLALGVGLGIGAVQAQDASAWGGAYAGLTYTAGTANQLYDGTTAFDLEGDGFGLVGGYNYSMGAWVFGGELAYSAAEIGEVPPNTEYAFAYFVDAKARAGYAINQFLVYGTVGGSFTRWEEGSSADAFDGSGLLYGAGVDYLMPSGFFVGAEFLVRDIESGWNNSGGRFTADVQTLSVRSGMKF